VCVRIFFACGAMERQTDGALGSTLARGASNSLIPHPPLTCRAPTQGRTHRKGIHQLAQGGGGPGRWWWWSAVVMVHLRVQRRSTQPTCSADPWPPGPCAARPPRPQQAAPCGWGCVGGDWGSVSMVRPPQQLQQVRCVCACVLRAAHPPTR